LKEATRKKKNSSANWGLTKRLATKRKDEGGKRKQSKPTQQPIEREKRSNEAKKKNTAGTQIERQERSKFKRGLKKRD